ncbi:MAG: hypothetical protein AB7H96_08310 [Vicinamibacterales bacterium]
MKLRKNTPIVRLDDLAPRLDVKGGRVSRVFGQGAAAHANPIPPKRRAGAAPAPPPK